MLSWDTLYLQAIPSEMLTKDPIFQLTGSSKPRRHCSFPKQLDPAASPFDLSRQVYMHLLKMHTYVFIFIRNPKMVDIGWLTNISYVILCACDSRNINNSHLLIAGGVWAAQQSSWDPFGAEQSGNMKLLDCTKVRQCFPRCLASWMLFKMLGIKYNESNSLILPAQSHRAFIYPHHSLGMCVPERKAFTLFY